MIDWRLKRLNRLDLLELMLEQSKEIDRLREEIRKNREILQERDEHLRNCSNAAEAAAQISSLYRTAQDAADLYLQSVIRICASRAEAAGKAQAWESFMAQQTADGRKSA